MPQLMPGTGGKLRSFVIFARPPARAECAARIYSPAADRATVGVVDDRRVGSSDRPVMNNRRRDTAEAQIFQDTKWRSWGVRLAIAIVFASAPRALSESFR